MRRISSPWTHFYKRVFPIIVLAFLALWTTGFVVGIADGEIPAIFLAFIVLNLLIVIGGGYFLMRKFIWPLADEVYLDQEELIVRREGDENRISIFDVINVDSSTFMNPERITLTFRHPSFCGSEISFIPTTRYFPFTRHPIAKELIALANPDVRVANVEN